MAKASVFGPVVRKARGKASYFRAYLAHLLSGQHGTMVPPFHLIYNVGNGDFRKVGEQHLATFIEVAGLKPEEHILEIGCGCGRMAVPLTGYLTGGGTYHGFDIVAPAVEWCQKNITPRHPNFQFFVADVYNKRYHPQGRYRACEYHFPLDDAAFDFVLLISVFTHMLPEDVENYMSEISRVLKPGGRCYATFFLLNEEARQLIDSGRSLLEIRRDFGKYAVADEEVPEVATALDVDFALPLFEKYGLEIQQPIHYGGWCGRHGDNFTQDVILARKGQADGPPKP